VNAFGGRDVGGKQFDVTIIALLREVQTEEIDHQVWGGGRGNRFTAAALGEDTFDEGSGRGAQGDHPLRVGLAHGDPQAPLIRTGVFEGMDGEVSQLAQAHAGVADQMFAPKQ
jgi:hypothetical protein